MSSGCRCGRPGRGRGSMTAAVRRDDVKPLCRAFCGVLVVATLLLGTAGTSGAVGEAAGTLPSPRADNTAPAIPPGVPVARVRTWLGRALTLRLDALESAASAVRVAGNLTAQHRVALDAIITSDQSGLSDLLAGLEGETTIVELRLTAGAMVLNYRVFSLLTPQVRAVVLADRKLAKVVTLAALEPSLQTAITTEKSSGHGAAAAQRIYEKLVALLSAVETSLGDSTAALLALTPENDAQGAQTFAGSAAALVATSSQIVSARADVRRIVKILGGA